MRHIFCMPYVYEGLGIAMLEAMSFGQPAIVSTMGAAGETFLHSTNGFVIAPEERKSVQETVERIEHFLKHLIAGVEASLEGDNHISAG